jgi:hypothetical protein
VQSLDRPELRTWSRTDPPDSSAIEEDPSQISILGHTIGAPTKLLPDVMERINELTAANRAMSSDVLAKISEATPGMYIGYGADQRAG